MGKTETKNIRNITVTGHNGCGKTILIESILYTAGQIPRLGTIEDGNTTTDFEPEEIKRQSSISAALAPCFYKNHKINLIDTPGYSDFIGEVVSALNITDTLLMVIDGTSGVQVQTDKIWSYVTAGTPKGFFINKLDKENSDFFSSLNSIISFFGKNTAVMQIPIGKDSSFKGFVDLLTMKAFLFTDGKSKEEEIPADLSDTASKYREMLIESVAETSDDLLEKYLEKGELSQDEIEKGLKIGFSNGSLFPIFCGSAKNLIGISSILDLFLSVFPSPSDLEEKKGINPKNGEEVARKPDSQDPASAFVFKTLTDPYVGKLNYVRVFSGHIKKDSHLLNSTKNIKERIGHILL
ncbi:MAG: GTP-binding protein, partial [Actinomycetia bacterium]|nr:GTP-binding protein [Actinomycetes bacterium]